MAKVTKNHLAESTIGRKETVKLRKRKLADGSTSLYLELTTMADVTVKLCISISGRAIQS